MSDPRSPSAPAVYRWRGTRLELLDYYDTSETPVLVADSWLVDEGRTLAVDLHRRRFTDTVAGSSGGGGVHPDPKELGAFWAAAIALIPATGAWFPRVELQDRHGSRQLIYRHRQAPERARSTVLATSPGPDPRRHPTVKGPDLVEMAKLRHRVRSLGADEAVILSEDGFVVEGAYSALLWWRGDTLCAPALQLPRIDSVTSRSVLTLAAALGTEVLYEEATPAELDGLEIWALSALHGIRIATAWIDGPAPAESPGRLTLWRDRLGRLSRPLGTVQS